MSASFWAAPLLQRGRSRARAEGITSWSLTLADDAGFNGAALERERKDRGARRSRSHACRRFNGAALERERKGPDYVAAAFDLALVASTGPLSSESGRELHEGGRDLVGHLASTGPLSSESGRP